MRSTSSPDRARPGVQRAVVLIGLAPLLALLLAAAPLVLAAPLRYGYPAAALLGTAVLLYLAYGRYADPGRGPGGGAALSVVVVVRDEAADAAARLGALAAEQPGAELIAVDNGSTDGTAAALERLALCAPLTVLHLDRPVAGHDAARHGAAHATGDLLAFVGAGVLLAPDALDRCAAALAADPGLGAVVAHTRARNAAANPLARAQDAWLDGRFRVVVGAEAAAGALVDAPTGLWVCRRAAVLPHLAAWRPGRSLGALAAGQRADGRRWRWAHPDSPFAADLDPPDRAWRVGYVASARAYVPVPTGPAGLLRAQRRRLAGALPGLVAAVRYGRSPLAAARAAAKLVAPAAATGYLVLAPLLGAWSATAAYLAAALLSGVAQGVAALVERPTVAGWAYAPVGRLGAALLHPLLPAYALLHALLPDRGAADTAR
ncbi:hypothetical protein GCM10010123_10550 [Pilimelia anulata]|uniref:4,4'-diaponeurosporenoate glycosyltransferase n=1 Tax=Pilimelia anulata TaxID=53371 RepID=A0A8J3F905_9ACTN|nr:glycosyltransferase family 2 protein [Pilimelia anulata]GGJ82780.1 hypothetical protein GCM10010123_10550 [Pilimelia anulata]